MGPFQSSNIADDNKDDEVEEGEDAPIVVEETNSISDDSENEITFAPDDFEPIFGVIKLNRFGLGYIGLNKDLLQKHVNLFSNFEVLDKNNKKVNIDFKLVCVVK